MTDEDLYFSIKSGIMVRFTVLNYLSFLCVSFPVQTPFSHPRSKLMIAHKTAVMDQISRLPPQKEEEESLPGAAKSSECFYYFLPARALHYEVHKVHDLIPIPSTPKLTPTSTSNFHRFVGAGHHR